MADIFKKPDVEKLLKNKSIWFFGDSNMRGMYKDLIWLLERNTLISLNSLRGKLEGSFLHDTLVRGGVLHRGRNFQEIRRYKNFKNQTDIEFVFLTKCNSRDLEERLKKCHTSREMPNVVVINSCVWDLTRWGPDSVAKYKTNIRNLIKLLKSSLPSTTRVIWITTPPISKEPRGGFFIKQVEFLKHTLRFDVMEANFFVSREFTFQGFDVLDIHYHLLLQIHRRRPDGIHWNPDAMRHITNLFLTHISICWKVPLPGNFKTPLLQGSDLEIFNPVQTIAPEENSLKPETEITDTFKNSVSSKQSKKKKRKRGAKRNRNGHYIGQLDFTSDDFDYDYATKKFKIDSQHNRLA